MCLMYKNGQYVLVKLENNPQISIFQFFGKIKGETGKFLFFSFSSQKFKVFHFLKFDFTAMNHEILFIWNQLFGKDERSKGYHNRIEKV